MRQSRKALALFLVILGSLSMAVKLTGPWPAAASEGSGPLPHPCPTTGSHDHGWDTYLLRFCECNYDRNSDLWCISAGCKVLNEGLQPDLTQLVSTCTTGSTDAEVADHCPLRYSAGFVFSLPMNSILASNDQQNDDSYLNDEIECLDIVTNDISPVQTRSIESRVESNLAETDTLALDDSSYDLWSDDFAGDTSSIVDGTDSLAVAADRDSEFDDFATSTEISAELDLDVAATKTRQLSAEEKLAESEAMLEVAESLPLNFLVRGVSLPAAELWLYGPRQSAASANFSGPIFSAGVPVATILAPQTSEQLAVAQHRLSLVLGIEALQEVASRLQVGYERAALKTATGLVGASKKIPQLLEDESVTEPQIGARPSSPVQRKASRFGRPTTARRTGWQIR
jgi:hypothetical protein